MNQQIADYFKTQPVVRAWIFGSYSRNEQRLWSDSDILPLREQVQCYLADIDWEKWAQGEDPYTEIDNAAYKQAVESARRMKAKGFAVTDIAEITGLTTEEIEGL